MDWWIGLTDLGHEGLFLGADHRSGVKDDGCHLRMMDVFSILDFKILIRVWH